MKKIFYLGIVIFATGIQAQDLQNANWAISSNGGLNFNNSLPLPFISNLDDPYSAATASDQNGNLLFYTNGKTVWNSDNTIMNNGTGLLAQGGKCSQNVVIVPNPADEEKYYIVSLSTLTIPAAAVFYGLRYSEVDLSGSSANVNATVKNSVLTDNLGMPIDENYPANLGKITTAKHGNGLDYWVIVALKDKILSYLLDETGFHSPVVSTPPYTFTYSSTSYWNAYTGPFKISPDNSKVLIGYSEIENQSTHIVRGSKIYAGLFNENTGQVSNFVELNALGLDEMRLTGGEFSPDGNTIHRSYDGINLSSSVTFIGTAWIESTPLFYETGYATNTIQRAINGKVYFEYEIGGSNPGTHIGVINNPNSYPYDFQYFPYINTGNTSSQSAISPWVQSQCIRTLTSSRNITGTVAKQRQDWIKSTDVFNGNTAQGIYHARNYLELNPGFETINNAGFVAYVEGCSNSFSYKNNIFGQEEVANQNRLHANKIKIFPNPSNKSITVSYDEPLKSIAIFSMDGKTILNRNMNESASEIDVSTFVNGIYLITAETQNGQFLQSKFIKN